MIALHGYDPQPFGHRPGVLFTNSADRVHAMSASALKVKRRLAEYGRTRCAHRGERADRHAGGATNPSTASGQRHLNYQDAGDPFFTPITQGSSRTIRDRHRAINHARPAELYTTAAELLFGYSKVRLSDRTHTLRQGARFTYPAQRINSLVADPAPAVPVAIGIRISIGRAPASPTSRCVVRIERITASRFLC